MRKSASSELSGSYEILLRSFAGSVFAVRSYGDASPAESSIVFAMTPSAVGLLTMVLVCSDAWAGVGLDELNTIAVFRDASRGVVHVTTRTKPLPNAASGPGGVGTGFVLDHEGHVVTAYHVIEGRDEILATLPSGERYVARVVGTSREYDVALLRIDARQGQLVPLKLGDSTSLQVGQKVLAIGNGYGLHNSLSVGVVSALGRTLRDGAPELQASFIQTDAAINPGNSGGPLLNSDGEVVGINDAMNPDAQSIGFAIPIHLIRSVLPDLVRMGHVYRPNLGFSGSMVRLEGTSGAMGFAIQEVMDDSPAAHGGLRGGRRANGDGDAPEPGDVIVGIDGKQIVNAGDLSRAITSSTPGAHMLLQVRRGSRVVVLRVTMPEMQHPGKVREGK
jgi:S1-C subfamily serine protease